jgi:leucyl aminopeptidase
MEFELISQLQPCELFVIPFWEGGKPASILPVEKSLFHAPLEHEDFTGKSQEMLMLYPDHEKVKRLLLVGLGKEQECDTETLRLAYSGVAKECQKRGLETLSLVIPQSNHIKENQRVEGVVEGLLLTNYVWESLKKTNEETVLLKSVSLLGVSVNKQSLIKRLCQEADAVYLARDFTNGNADEITPDFLVKYAKSLSKKYPTIKATILRRKEIEKQGLGLLAAVGRASTQEPALVSLSYKGDPKSSKHTLLVGKGVTYDTGGLSLKTTSGMVTMRDDMSGAGCVLTTLNALAEMKYKGNVSVVTPLTENNIDSHSFKIGDVYEGYSGHTVEILNTDAEGRLILADALAWGIKKHKPTQVIDVATLTGSVVRALGSEVSGLFSNHDKLANKLIEAGEDSQELLHRLPLPPLYKKRIYSDIADLKNVDGPDAGSIFAALFLEAFTNGVPWAHLDIAGTAFRSKERGYHPKNGSGFGVRLLLRFFLKN